MAKGVPQVIEGIPYEAINEAKKSYENVKVRVARRNDKGQLGTVYGSIVRTLDELFEIDAWLANMAGGGEYRIEARDPNNPATWVVPPFKVKVEGAPHKPKFLGSPTGFAPDQSTGGGPGMFDPNNQPPPPPWLAGMHPAMQQYYGGYDRYTPPRMPRSSQLAPGATMASDQVAMRELSETKAALAETRAELKAFVDKHDTETQRLRDQLADERERAREARHQAEMKLMMERIEMAEKARQAPAAEPQQSAIERFAWLAPVLVAWLESNGNKDAKAIEMQQNGMKTLLEASLQQSNRADPGMEMMKSVVMPMMLKQMEAKSPKALAELYNATTENNLNSVAMMAQLIEAFAANQENEPWWLPMVKETMNGAMGITEHIMNSQRPEPPRMQPGAPPPQQMAAPPQAPQEAVYKTETAQPPAPAPQATEDQSRPQNVQEALMLGMLPPDFQTKPWKRIVLALHKDTNLERVVNTVTQHLEHLIEFDDLPQLLADLVDYPEEALQRVLQPMPAFQQRRDFVEAVYSNVLLALREDGYIVLDVEQETEQEQRGEHPPDIETDPAPPEEETVAEVVQEPAPAAAGA